MSLPPWRLSWSPPPPQAETSSLGITSFGHSIVQRQESIFQHFPGQALESPRLRPPLPEEKQQLAGPLLQARGKAVGQSGPAPDSNPDVRRWRPCLRFPIVKHGSTTA